MKNNNKKFLTELIELIHKNENNFDNVELTYMYSTVGYCNCAIIYDISLNNEDIQALTQLKMALLER